MQGLLQGLESQNVDNALYEIIVIDDGSNDGTADFLQEFVAVTGNRCYAASLSENGGPARARNAGLAACRGRVILIIGDGLFWRTAVTADTDIQNELPAVMAVIGQILGMDLNGDQLLQPGIAIQRKQLA